MNNEVSIIDAAARLKLSESQRDKLLDNIRTSLNAFERNSGKTLKKRDRLVYEHLLIGGAISALDALSFDAPAIFGICIMTGRSVLEEMGRG